MNRFVHRGLILGGCAWLAALGSAGAAGTNAPAADAAPALRDPFSSPLAPPPASVVRTNATVAAPGPVAPPVLTPDLSAELQRALRIQGYVQQGGRCYAMINGRLVTEGEVVQVRVGAATQRFRVRSVTATNVQFEPLP